MSAEVQIGVEDKRAGAPRLILFGAVLLAFACLGGACSKAETKNAAAANAELSGPDDALASDDDATGMGADAQVTRSVATAPLDTSTWAVKPPFYAAGDEPYWRLEFEDGWFSFRRSGLSAIEAPAADPKHAGGADVFDAPPLTIKLKPGDCQSGDGRSGSGEATVSFDSVDYEGCVFAGDANTGSAEAAAIAEAIIPIDGCLGKLGEPALVTGLYPREESLTSMGLRTRDGRLYECAAQPNGEIAFLDPIEPNSASPWITAGLRFLRDGQAGVKADCAAGEVVNSGDARLGVILARACRF